MAVWLLLVLLAASCWGIPHPAINPAQTDAPTSGDLPTTYNSTLLERLRSTTEGRHEKRSAQTRPFEPIKLITGENGQFMLTVWPNGTVQGLMEHSSVYGDITVQPPPDGTCSSESNGSKGTTKLLFGNASGNLICVNSQGRIYGEEYRSKINCHDCTWMELRTDNKQKYMFYSKHHMGKNVGAKGDDRRTQRGVNLFASPSAKDKKGSRKHRIKRKWYLALGLGGEVLVAYKAKKVDPGSKFLSIQAKIIDGGSGAHYPPATDIFQGPSFQGPLFQGPPEQPERKEPSEKSAHCDPYDPLFAFRIGCRGKPSSVNLQQDSSRTAISTTPDTTTSQPFNFFQFNFPVRLRHRRGQRRRKHRQRDNARPKAQGEEITLNHGEDNLFAFRQT